MTDLEKMQEAFENGKLTDAMIADVLVDNDVLRKQVFKALLAKRGVYNYIVNGYRYWGIK